MTTDPPRVPLGRAQVIAWTVLRELAPCCDRIEIAGSIRRRKETVKDVEILAVPKPGRTDLFGKVFSDALTDYLESQIGRGHWELRPSKIGAATFGPSNKLLIFDGLPIDVFTTTEAHWAMSLFVRTGPAEWNVKAMVRFQRLGMRGHAYDGLTGVTRDGKDVPVADERDVFRLLDWPWAEPELRV